IKRKNLTYVEVFTSLINRNQLALATAFFDFFNLDLPKEPLKILPLLLLLSPFPIIIYFFVRMQR
ncbi:MAG TPA: hypothetical protein PLF48_07240, partial [Chitinophagales bacterium]|nr:hypothetical protein [Chitinophagales bacterium]